MLSLTRNIVPRLVAPISRVQAIQCAPISTSMTYLSSDDEMSKVGPYPRTKEERERAAKKYNLIPEDYEPYDECEGLGDYPKLKAVGGFNRDPYDDFDDMVDNRYYGEPFHLDADLYYWERIDPLAHEKKPRLSIWIKALIFFGLPITMSSLFYIFKYYGIQINHPWKQRYYLPDQRYFEFPSK